MLTATFIAILSVNLAISGGVPQFLISTGVAGGYPDNPPISPPTTEIIDLADEEMSCSNLEDFPVEIFGAVGANLGSVSIICGGGSDDVYALKQCYKLLKNGGWEEFTTMISGRRFAASIVRENALHVFGGWGENSTEIIHQDGQIVQGPDMPVALGLHAIASVNSTTSIISGGDYDHSADKDLTWYYNHVTQQFQSGPPLVVGRMFHSSGTVIDQETKEKIVAVAGGYNEHSGYLDSTELLIDGEWRQGPRMPKAIFLSTKLEVGGDFYVIGGLEYWSDQTFIHKLTCKARECEWTTINQQLKVGRANAVAIPLLDDSFCTPN